MTTQLTGQLDLVSAQETVALPGDTDVASFTDANLSDTANSFTATIVWGDGVTTTGATVVGSNGSFTVEGGHTYGDEGLFNATVTVTRTADNSQLVLGGGVGVSDTDAITGHNAPTITGNPNQALSNVTVATFTDTNQTNTASDFTVSIDWGDGTTTAGTLNGGTGTFTVTGSHTYAAAGQYTITTFMGDDAADAAFGDATTTAAIGFGGTETLQSATETFAVTAGTPVAVFTDNSNLPSTDYTVMIDWGDGTTTAGNVSGSGGSFTVTSASDHTYSDDGDFILTANIQRTTDHATIAPSGTVLVGDFDSLNATGMTIHSPNLVLTNVTVANFSDTNGANPAADFIATIEWGDGTSSAGTVSGTSGTFTVNGSHTYAQGGTDAITVDIADDPSPGIDTAVAEATSTAIVGLSPGTGTSFNIPEGSPTGPIAVATFNDGNISDQTTAFTATISWGDGSTDTGTLSGGNGSFTVSSSSGHTYADEGSDTITTVVTRTADHAQVTITGTATVDDADSITLSAANIQGNANVALNNVQVATFTTAYTGNVAGDFLASIEWGDGTTSAGTISGGGGAFTVTGTHTYTSGGNDTLRVTVSDDAPGTASAVRTGTASIILNPPPPAGTTADMITVRGSDGSYEIYDLGQNALLAAHPLTQIGPPWQAVGLGGFNGTDTTDMMLRNSSTGAFQIADVSNNNLTGTAMLGAVGLDQVVAGFGDFSTHAGETDMMLRNANSGAFTIYDISNNAVAGTHAIGAVGLDWLVTGFADLSGNANETDMLLRNKNSGQFEIYDINNNAVTGTHSLGAVGLDWAVMGFGDFSGIAGENDMMMRNSSTGEFKIYDISNNAVTGTHSIGAVGLDWTVAGFGNFSGNANETDMMLRSSSSGQFQIYDISNNAVAGTHSIGATGPEWSVVGIAKDPPTSAAPSSGAAIASDAVQSPSGSPAGSDSAGTGGWLAQMIPSMPSLPAVWLTQAMQASVAGSGPGFDAGSDLFAGTAPASSSVISNPFQPHTG